MPIYNENDTKVSPNGYHYTRQKGKWRLTHHIIAEKRMGRLLKTGERVYFVDGNRTNLDPDNIEVRRVKTKADRIEEKRRKIKQLQAEIKELQSKV